MENRRQRLKNRPVAQKPGCGVFQYVRMMDGEELCAIGIEATLAEVRATVLRLLNLCGPVAATVHLIPVEASSSSKATCEWQVVLDPSAMPINEFDAAQSFDAGLCDVCSGAFGKDACFLLDASDACTLCYPTDCCSRCSHIWQSQQMKNDHGEEVRPGTRICALCMKPAMLDAEKAYVTSHFRLVALAHHQL